MERRDGRGGDDEACDDQELQEEEEGVVPGIGRRGMVVIGRTRE